MNKYTQELMDYMQNITVIDAHEHLLPERHRIIFRPDLFVLFSQYIPFDIRSAGYIPEETGNNKMSSKWPNFHYFLDQKIPLKKRWDKFFPYWENIKFSGYGQSALYAARLVYDVDDINGDTYQELSNKINSFNKTGLYEHVLKNICNIRYILNQSEDNSCFEDMFLQVYPAYNLCRITSSKDIKINIGKENKNCPDSINEYINIINQKLQLLIENGVIALKLLLVKNDVPNYNNAAKEYLSVLKNETISDGEESFSPLYNYIFHAILNFANSKNLTVALHSGVINNFHDSSPMSLYRLAIEYPNIKFDLFHLGMPYIDESIFLCKNYSNIFLNLCWCHVISPKLTCEAILKILDLVPINKIIAFGGDYKLQVEKVAGHLYMAKRNIAYALAQKIEFNCISKADALRIIDLWFYYNPLRIYGLEGENN